MIHHFQFGNHNSMDFCMAVEKYPTISSGSRKRTAISVAGRSGDLHYVEDAFTNFQQSYECYFSGQYPSPQIAHEIKAWLFGDGAYHRLTDSYDTKHFRLASFAGPLDVKNHLNKYGRCTVVFDCDPRAFLWAGEDVVTFTQEGQIYNPTGYSAKPKIIVRGTSGGNVAVNGTTVEVKTLSDFVILDCEIQDAYRQAGNGGAENKNGTIYAPEFPVLKPGANGISFTGGITQIEIIPRWWEL